MRSDTICGICKYSNSEIDFFWSKWVLKIQFQHVCVGMTFRSFIPMPENFSTRRKSTLTLFRPHTSYFPTNFKSQKMACTSTICSFYSVRSCITKRSLLFRIQCPKWDLAYFSQTKSSRRRNGEIKTERQRVSRDLAVKARGFTRLLVFFVP
jgi:hypothetical protein